MSSQKSYSVSLEVDDVKVATFVRAVKSVDETTSKQYPMMLNAEKENYDTVRMFSLVKARIDNGYNNVHYYYGLIPIVNIEAVIELHNSNICEMLTTFPYRLYFDIDDKTCKLTLTKVFEILKKFFGLRKRDITVSGYETDSKHSYHVIAKNYTLNTPSDLIYMKKAVTAINASEFDGVNVFDPAVYTKNRQMKCVFQSKPQGTVAKPLHPKETSSKYNLREFFIASFVPKDATAYFSSNLINVDVSSKLGVTTEELPTTKISLPKDFYWTPNDMYKANVDTARKILSLVPDIDSHAHRRTVACFCMGNGLTQQDFNNWFYKQAPSSERKKKVALWWDNTHATYIQPTFYKPLTTMIKYLAKWYPELTMENPNTGYFMNSFDLDIPSTNIETEYIQPEHFQADERVLIFNIGMGGGKTTATLKELKRREKDTFVWLAPRQTLVQNTSGRMKKEYALNHITHLDVGNDKGKLSMAKHLIICNQSLHYLNDDIKYDIVIIDEIETVFLSWLDEETHGKNLKANFKMFCNILRRASKVILLDAFITTKTLNLLTDLGISKQSIKLYTSKQQPKQRKLVFNPTEDQIVNKIVDSLVLGEKSYIFYPFKKPSKKHMGIIEFDTYIKEKVKEKRLSTAKTAEEKLAIHETSLKSLLYYAESKEKNNLGDINILWDDVDYILTTSSITVGVNYEHKDVYHNVFLLVSGATNVPRDIIQSSMRIRHPINTDINYHLYDVALHDIAKFPSYFHDEDTIYKNLVVQNLREIQAGFVESFCTMCNLTNYKLDVEHDTLFKVKQRKDFINTMYESSNLIEYSKVPKIDDEEKIEALKFKTFNRCADMIDRLTVERFYHDQKFRNLDEDERALIWNTNRKSFFDGIDNEFIKMVEADNQIDAITQINPRSLEVSETTLEYISTNYSIVKSKKIDSKVIQVINNILGFEAISIKTDKSKHKVIEVSQLAKTLYECHLKKKCRDELEKVIKQAQFIEEEKTSLSKAEWRDKWYSVITDSDYIPATTWYEDETSYLKYELPWEVNPEAFHLQSVPAKSEYKYITKYPSSIIKHMNLPLPPIKGVQPPHIPTTMVPRAPQGAKPSASTPRPIRVVAPTH